MKKDICNRIVTGAVEKLIKFNVNSACWFVFHQPKLPKGTERFKKQVIKIL